LEDAEGGEHFSGAEGLASAKGFEILLKKARGELTSEQAAEEAARSKRQAEEAARRLADNDEDGDGDHLSKILEAAENAKETADGDASGQGTGAVKTEEDKKYDDSGQRVISLQQVRREIWLNHNRIPMKRLLKIFNIKKKTSEDRQEAFRDVIRELCNMEDDPLGGGKILVLKQHYQM
jgi:hypothetical protein